MFTANDHQVLKERYETIGAEGDDRGTATDFNLRELEIDTGSSYMNDGDFVLDVGCGTGYSLRQYAKRHAINGFGIDYAQAMVDTAKKRAAQETGLVGSVDYRQASVMELPFADNAFNVITSARCLMALLDWGQQQAALLELKRVLKPGGVLVLMEGTYQGLDRLNQARQQFGLPAIPPDGRDRLFTLKFDEAKLVGYCSAHYELVTIHRFGMYYFLTRVVHPLLVAPEQPKNDAKINAIALEIARKHPNFEDLGHLVGFVLRKPR
jgi:SAM-dependent methyltransferase